MHSAIILLIAIIPLLAMIIVSIICFMQAHCWFKITWIIFCVPTSLILILTIFSAICRLHCVINTTVVESEKEYEIIDIEEINCKYYIAYIDDDIVKTITTDNVYDIFEITTIIYDINEKTFSRKNDYAVKITEACSSPSIIQKMALLSIKKNPIRIYTCNKELLNQYKEYTDNTVWYIASIIIGIYCTLLAIGMIVDWKKQNVASKN